MRLVCRKLIFHLQMAVIGDSFCVRDGDVCQLFLLSLGPHLMQACAGTVHAATVSVSHMCIGPAGFRRSCFLDVLHALWLLQSIPLHLWGIP